MTTTTTETDRRLGPRRRNRALCCVCGTLRTVAATSFTKRPEDAPDLDDHARFVRWLKCETCRTSTDHAVLNDDPRLAGRDFTEEREADLRIAKRRLDRWIRWLKGDGVEVLWSEGKQVGRKPKPNAMPGARCAAIYQTLDSSGCTSWILELAQDAPADWLVRAIKDVVELVDEPDRLLSESTWRTGDEGERWRGAYLSA